MSRLPIILALALCGCATHKGKPLAYITPLPAERAAVFASGASPEAFHSDLDFFLWPNTDGRTCVEYNPSSPASVQGCWSALACPQKAVLTFTTQPGANYRLQSKARQMDDLKFISQGSAGTLWQFCTAAIAGTGGPVEVTMGVPDEPAWFWRVLESQ